MRSKHLAFIALLIVAVSFFQIQPPHVNAATLPVSTSLPHQFQIDLHQGSVNPDVALLQQYLNAEGFTVASTGPGSPGNENDYFGLLTKNALIAFQNAHKADVLLPAGLISGSGNFFSLTRAYVNAHPLVDASSSAAAAPFTASSTPVVITATTAATGSVAVLPLFATNVNLTPSFVYRHHHHVSQTLVDPTIFFADGSGVNDGGFFPYLITTVTAFSNSPGHITYFLNTGDPSLFSVDPATGQVYALQAGASGVISIGARQDASGSYNAKTVYDHVTVIGLA